MSVNTKTLFVPMIIIVVIIGVVLLSRDGGRQRGPGVDSSGFLISSSAIYIAEQAVGQSVSVALVRFEKPGFVVIHEDTVGAPGAILGASSVLPSGETENPPPITLSRMTRDGETLHAMLHVDDGDGAFDATRDRPIADPTSGEPMTMVVTVSADTREGGVVNP